MDGLRLRDRIKTVKSQLVLYPDPILNEVCEPVDLVTGMDEARQVVNDLFVNMRVGFGVGLAAPQIGSRLRIFVMNATGQSLDDLVFINPELVETLGDPVAGSEGCLSLPGITGRVFRNSRIRVRGTTLSGETRERTLINTAARVFQHELDHTNGILFLRHLSTTALVMAETKLRALRKKYKAAHVAHAIMSA